MNQVNIYIDTSIKGPRRAAGSYMYLIEAEIRGKTADCGKWKHLDETTEYHASLCAIQEALERLNKPCSIHLYTECAKVFMVLDRELLKKWEQNQWKNAHGEPVSHEEKWRQILYLLNAHDFQVHYREQHGYRDWMKREMKKREEKTG